ADRNRSHWSTSKTPSYTKSVSWQHHQERFTALKAEFEAQLEEEARLNRAIVDNLAKVVL
ncbi:hypothetical protein PO551_10715, partial [Escherichia coli]